MRDRLLLAFASLTLAVIAAFLVLRGHATSELVHAQEQRKAERSAETMAGLIGFGPEVTGERLARVLHTGEQVVYVDPDGRRVEATASGGSFVEPEPADLTVTRRVPGGGTLTLTRDASVVDARVANALLPLVVMALALAVVAAAGAVWLSRRMSRPFRELAAVAERIGRGSFDVDVPRFKVPEADAVARVLRASAFDLERLVRRERDFAAHASHELRTPITATRLELEDLVLSPSTPPEVVSRLSDALEQLDRLSATVAGMLDANRESRIGDSFDIDLAALVHDAATRWHDAARGRRIEVTCQQVVAVRLPAGSLIQVMDVLLNNAVGHGEGPITVTVTEALEYAEVRVADEGPHNRAVEGVKRALTAGTGGLATATEIVESLGGQLRLTDDARTTFSLVLPRARRETVVS